VCVSIFVWVYGACTLVLHHIVCPFLPRAFPSLYALRPSSGTSHRNVYIFFLKRYSFISGRPSGGSPDPSVRPRILCCVILDRIIVLWFLVSQNMSFSFGLGMSWAEIQNYKVNYTHKFLPKKTPCKIWRKNGVKHEKTSYVRWTNWCRSILTPKCFCQVEKAILFYDLSENCAFTQNLEKPCFHQKQKQRFFLLKTNTASKNNFLSLDLLLEIYFRQMFGAFVPSQSVLEFNVCPGGTFFFEIFNHFTMCTFFSSFHLCDGDGQTFQEVMN
jgi:hypothetical protein